MNRRIKLNFVTLIMTGLLLAGCSNSPDKPVSLLEQVEDNLYLAEEIGAKEYAPLELRSGKENLQQAKRAMDDEEYGRAKDFLEKASADIQLASAKSQAEKSKDSVEQINENLNALEQAL